MDKTHKPDASACGGRRSHAHASRRWNLQHYHINRSSPLFRDILHHRRTAHAGPAVVAQPTRPMAPQGGGRVAVFPAQKKG
ncbi:MAG: hypothetical protein AB7G06_06475 [Bdellovibrionales bacterium]